MKDPIAKIFVLHNIRGTIIGVVKDFNYANLKEDVHPLILNYCNAERVFVRSRPIQALERISAVHHFWKQYNGAYLFA